MDVLRIFKHRQELYKLGISFNSIHTKLNQHGRRTMGMYIIGHILLIGTRCSNTAFRTKNAGLNTPLEQEDKEIYDLIEKEKWRQYSCLELIASEVFT